MIFFVILCFSTYFSISLFSCVPKLLRYFLYNSIDKFNNRGTIVFVVENKKGGGRMNKSVYSLVLMDNVVGEVDELAYEMGTSRSNLINQILADEVGARSGRAHV